MLNSKNNLSPSPKTNQSDTDNSTNTMPLLLFEGMPVTLTKGFFKCQRNSCKLRTHYHQSKTKRGPQLHPALIRKVIKAKKAGLCKEVTLCKAGVECYEDFPDVEHYHLSKKAHINKDNETTPEELVVAGAKLDEILLSVESEQAQSLSDETHSQTIRETISEPIESSEEISSNDETSPPSSDYVSDQPVDIPEEIEIYSNSVSELTDNNTESTAPSNSGGSAVGNVIYEPSLRSDYHESENLGFLKVQVPIYIFRKRIERDKEKETILESWRADLIDFYRYIFYKLETRAPLNSNIPLSLNTVVPREVNATQASDYNPYWYTRLMFGKRFTRHYDGKYDQMTGLYNFCIYENIYEELADKLLQSCGTFSTGNFTGEVHVWCANRVTDQAMKINAEYFSIVHFNTTLNTIAWVVNKLALATTFRRDATPNVSMSECAVQVIKSGKNVHGTNFP